MIHIAIGTKAQFIKMAPVMRRLKESNIAFNLIDLGQHSLITKGLRDEFQIKDPDIYLSEGKNISKITYGLIWLIVMFSKGLSTGWVKEKVFLGKKGICLIQGDTVSTLLALYLAKRAGIKTTHLEAGVRSYNYLDPFPEEILRVLVMRFSDILFAPTRYAFDNLKRMGLEKGTVLISGNTSIESTFYSLNKTVDLGLNLDKYALVTVHRMGNIFAKKKLSFIVDFVEKISSRLPVVFVQHPPTINQLKKFKLQERLEKIANVHFFKLLSHRQFVHLLKGCEFVITDGGGIQEESFYLDKPCLFLRKRTEWIHTVGKNVMLFDFSRGAADYFINHYHELKADFYFKEIKPSQEIFDIIKCYA